MSKKILFIIASSWFQDYEYGEPRRILEEAWFEIDVASDKKGECIWSFWNIVISDYGLDEVQVDNYDLVVMVWWPWAWQVFNNNKSYLEISKKAKLLWAICIAPAIVSDSWIYNWVKITWWDSWWEQINYIKQNGWIYTWDDVVVSGKYITANWPRAATKFWEELVKILL